VINKNKKDKKEKDENNYNKKKVGIVIFFNPFVSINLLKIR